MAGPRSPTFPVTAQLISRRWRLLSSCCYADFQQRSNERLVVLPHTRYSSYHGVENIFVWMVWNISKTCKTMAGPCSPKHNPVPFTMLNNFFGWILCSRFKNFQVDGWAALPNIPCHSPAHFAALKKVFVLVLCSLSTAFKWTAGRAPPNTVQLISRCWVNYSPGWHEAFQKHSILKLARAPPNTAQFLSRCWKIFSSGFYAAISKTIKLMPGPRFPTSPVTAQLVSRR